MGMESFFVENLSDKSLSTVMMFYSLRFDTILGDADPFLGCLIPINILDDCFLSSRHLFKILFIIVRVLVYMWLVVVSWCVEVREQLCGAASLFPPLCGFWE